MAVIRLTFEWAGDLYGRWFADWLHVHFLIRTVLLLFALWLIIFLAAQLIQYFIAPVFLMFFYYVIFRAWNFLFVETSYEWLYIHYYSRDKPKFSSLYSKLYDKVKHNRIILSHTKYKGMLLRSRRFATQLMVICAVAATLWVSAFGLHHEYVASAMVVIEREVNENSYALEDDSIDGREGKFDLYNEEVLYYSPPDILFYPFEWRKYAVLALNEAGREGARLRDGPGISGQIIIEILWDDDTLIYLNKYVPDAYVNGLFWLRVQSPGGTVGYISSQLIEVEGQ